MRPKKEVSFPHPNKLFSNLSSGSIMRTVRSQVILVLIAICGICGAEAKSFDTSFDLQLIGSDSSVAQVTRGPYLQTGTPSSVIVRWRTDLATDSRVRYGTTVGSLTSNADNPLPATEHEVAVSGLAADTLYYYSIGTSSATLAGG